MFIRIVRDSLFVTSIAVLAGCTEESSKSEPAPASAPAPASTAPPALAPAPNAAPGALSAAHEAYLAGDFVAVGERIRDVLLDPSSGALAKENALELLDKAYEASKGKLPTRFALPAGFDSIKVGAARVQNQGNLSHNLFLFMRVRDGLAARLSRITVRRLHDEVLLDKVSGPGKVTIKHQRPGYEDVVLEANGRLASVPADGVISIRADVDGAPAIDTWVLARGLAASTAPEVLSPLASTSLKDANPLVQWKPFRSAEFMAFEERTLSVHVQDQSTKQAAWELWKFEPGDLGVVRIGDHPETPKTKLAAGTYWLSLMGGEERSFGPIRIARNSRTGFPFNVVE
ncbi:MAG TPA: hypothetical protein VM925_26750 [Labilithrix sp.]|jgi:hypothetical protein|nr:hypothetical protein [Labilithrix sp.]